MIGLSTYVLGFVLAERPKVSALAARTALSATAETFVNRSLSLRHHGGFQTRGDSSRASDTVDY
jgi:hypothetical protein